MASDSRVRATRLCLFAGFALSSALAVVYAQPARPAGATRHLADLVALGKKFEGAATCGGSSCHGGGSQQTPPTKIGSEMSIWQAKDAHAKAATIVTKPDTKANPWMATIAQTLGIGGDLLTSDACISCHGSPVPQHLQGEKFSQAEGVSCYQCHGPSEAWRVPHQTKGWTDKEREKLKDHATLLATHGLFDTRPPVQRAEMCASCHLAIDEKLVKAGHPQPIFEQLAFQAEEPEHWIERNIGFGRLNLYAAGQIVAMRESLGQLVARPSDAGAFDQAMVHLRIVRLLAGAEAFDADAVPLQAALDALVAGRSDPAAVKKAAGDAAALAAGLLDSVAKQPVEGDQAKMKAALDAFFNADVAAFGSHGRRGYEQLFFAADRLVAGYREGLKLSAAQYKPIRDAGKPLRDLKLFEGRNSGEPVQGADAVFASALKAIDAELKKLP